MSAIPPARRRRGARARRADQPRLRAHQGRPTRGTSTAPARPRGPVYTAWVVLQRARAPHVHAVAEGAGAHRGPGRHLRHRQHAGELDPRPGRRSPRARSTRTLMADPGDASSPSRSPSRAAGSGATGPQALGASGSAPRSQVLPEVQSEGRRPSRASQTFAVLPPALPGGGNFPVEFVIASTAEPSEILDFAQAAAGEGGEERHVRLPAAHRHQDRPAAVGDRHRPRQGGGAGPEPRRRSGRTSAPRWAATSSTASASTAAATRSFRSCCASSGSTPSSCRTSTSPGPNGKLVAAQHHRHPARTRSRRARSTASSSSTR